MFVFREVQDVQDEIKEAFRRDLKSEDSKTAPMPKAEPAHRREHRRATSFENLQDTLFFGR